MSEKKSFCVQGHFQGSSINKIEQAYSSKQAKLQAAFHSGIGGKDVKRFLSNNNIKVVKR